MNTNDLQISFHSKFLDFGARNINNDCKSIYKTDKIFAYLCKMLDIECPKQNIEYIWGACFFVKSKQSAPLLPSMVNGSGYTSRSAVAPFKL